MYNGNSAGQRGESDLDEVKQEIRQVKSAMGGSTVEAEVEIYKDWEPHQLRRELEQLREKENLLLRQQQPHPGKCRRVRSPAFLRLCCLF
uniref:Uncharacterized protein n=1 Tax=Chromera velia CCMP2878 TaxID=1169474 RepID=A0A0G4FDZ2_9ALVE|eukprot:Cvel_16541.t1-p1 / transcript=Cvel_16541.t1 / gene=Cvel_16541 / organism=Chromera_velia_CCMP2878 / gene_product=hypothetical protein / transcript_product=hypothetical protein / location=Cvel_scaffold1278:36774-37040(+) / protein_length=89 / sequence_SO=supercontig / SO=protein_coding / is_pseudo=false